MPKWTDSMWYVKILHIDWSDIGKFFTQLHAVTTL